MNVLPRLHLGNIRQFSGIATHCANTSPRINDSVPFQRQLERTYSLVYLRITFSVAQVKVNKMYLFAPKSHFAQTIHSISKADFICTLSIFYNNNLLQIYEKALYIQKKVKESNEVGILNNYGMCSHSKHGSKRFPSITRVLVIPCLIYWHDNWLFFANWIP